MNSKIKCKDCMYFGHLWGMKMERLGCLFEPRFEKGTPDYDRLFRNRRPNYRIITDEEFKTRTVESCEHFKPKWWPDKED